MDKKINILFRYSLLIILAIPNFYLFYLVFTPLTLYPSFFLLKIFLNATLIENIIHIGSTIIFLIGACIGGSAYYFLLALNILTPNIKKRFSAIIFSFLSFLILNIIRIFLFVIIYSSSINLFNATHLIFWYFGSTILVLGIWFFEVKRHSNRLDFWVYIFYFLVLKLENHKLFK